MSKKDVRFLVDYLAFTISRLDFFSDDSNEYYIFERIQKKLLLRGFNYVCKRSFYGYTTCYNAAGISICFGGREDIYIQMSGTGCRAWESLNPSMTWEEYIRLLQSTYGSLHFARMDVACDTVNMLNIDKVLAATRFQKYVSRWRTYLVQEGNKEKSVIFGAAKSDFRCRIYDKSLERKVKTDREDVPENWVRIEFQLRNESVLSFLRPWQSSKDLPATFLGLLRNQLLYYKFYDGKNNDRMILTPWWEKLLDNACRIKMAYRGGMEYNLESLKGFVLDQAGSSVRTYMELFGIDQLVHDVQKRSFSDKQLDLIRRYQDNVQPAPAAAEVEAKTYVCDQCGRQLPESDFVVYGPGKCYCRDCMNHRKFR